MALNYIFRAGEVENKKYRKQQQYKDKATSRNQTNSTGYST